MEVIDGVAYDATAEEAGKYRYTTQMRRGCEPTLYLASNSLRKIKEAIRAARMGLRWIQRNDDKEFVLCGRGGRQVLYDAWPYNPRR